MKNLAGVSTLEIWGKQRIAGVYYLPDEQERNFINDGKSKQSNEQMLTN